MGSNKGTPPKYLVAHPLAAATASKCLLQPSTSFLSWYSLPLFFCSLFKLLNVCRIPFPSDRFQLTAYEIEIRTFFPPFSTIPACFCMCALSLYLGGKSMTFTSIWVAHFALKALDSFPLF